MIAIYGSRRCPQQRSEHTGVSRANAFAGGLIEGQPMIDSNIFSSRTVAGGSDGYHKASCATTEVN